MSLVDYKDHTWYMKLAELVSTRSHDNRHLVGCVIVRNKQILAEGYNGTPSGADNTTRDSDGKTLETVIHSEANALMKLARYGGSSDGATLYCTYSPCFECAKLILQAGITRIVYGTMYCEKSNLFLIERGFNVRRPNREYYTILERQA